MDSKQSHDKMGGARGDMHVLGRSLKCITPYSTLSRVTLPGWQRDAV